MRGTRGGNEIECLSRKSRRIAKLRPADVRAAKRSFWKRQRKEGRHTARVTAQGAEAAIRRPYVGTALVRFPISMIAIPATITTRPTNLVISIGRLSMPNKPNWYTYSRQERPSPENQIRTHLRCSYRWLVPLYFARSRVAGKEC